MRQIQPAGKNNTLQPDPFEDDVRRRHPEADPAIRRSFVFDHFTGLGAVKERHPVRTSEFGRLSDEATLILKEAGIQAFRFIRGFVNPGKNCRVISATSDLNHYHIDDRSFNHVINLKRVNDIRRINKFFETVNRSLDNGGYFIGRVETYPVKKAKIMAAYPAGVNMVIYAIYFILHRVFPKLPFSKQLYFMTTRGNNRVLSRAESYGRLYSCGFEIVDDEFINGYYYFAARKIKEPVYDTHPTFGMFIRLRRIGRGGEFFFVYKLRTMHAYSEYLQHYLYQKNNLDEGGKFKEDFRVTTLGRIMRRFWIDELPMLINIMVKRNMKLVGVRPLSEHYFHLYSENLRAKRIAGKPGLIPPYYAQYPTPKTLDEIQQNELEYLAAYEKNPFLTDLRYFFKAMGNIFFRKARSK